MNDAEMWRVRAELMRQLCGRMHEGMVFHVLSVFGVENPHALIVPDATFWTEERTAALKQLEVSL